MYINKHLQKYLESGYLYVSKQSVEKHLKTADCLKMAAYTTAAIQNVNKQLHSKSTLDKKTCFNKIHIDDICKYLIT